MLKSLASSQVPKHPPSHPSPPGRGSRAHAGLPWVLWLLHCNLLGVPTEENTLGESSSDSNIPTLLFSRKTDAQRGSVPRRVAARCPRGAARLPPRADPPGAVPGSAGAAGRLRPQDLAEKPAEPGPGRLARRAQALAHGGRWGAVGRVPLSAPLRRLYSRRTRSPAPGRSKRENRPGLGSASSPAEALARVSSWDPHARNRRPQGSLPFGCH